MTNTIANLLEAIARALDESTLPCTAPALLLGAIEQIIDDPIELEYIDITRAELRAIADTFERIAN